MPTAPATATLLALLLTAASCGESANGEDDERPSATKQPQFLRQPIVVFNNQGTPPDPIYRVYLRTDRPLPRDRRGARGTIEIETVSDDYPRLFTLSRRKRCYWTYVVGVGALAKPRDGQQVEVTLRVLGSRRNADRARVRIDEVSPSQFDDDDAQARLLRKLGCPKGNI